MNDLLKAVGLAVVSNGVFSDFGCMGNETVGGVVRPGIFFSGVHFGVDFDVAYVGFPMSIEQLFAALIECEGVSKGAFYAL